LPAPARRPRPHRRLHRSPQRTPRLRRPRKNVEDAHQANEGYGTVADVFVKSMTETIVRARECALPFWPQQTVARGFCPARRISPDAKEPRETPLHGRRGATPSRSLANVLAS